MLDIETRPERSHFNWGLMFMSKALCQDLHPAADLRCHCQIECPLRSNLGPKARMVLPRRQRCARAQTTTLMHTPTLIVLVLNHAPFAQRSTPQQARHQTSTHWPLPSLAQATHSHQMREPRRPFGRLAMTDGMDRYSGAPLPQLGLVTRVARPSGWPMSAGRPSCHTDD